MFIFYRVLLLISLVAFSWMLVAPFFQQAVLPDKKLIVENNLQQAHPVKVITIEKPLHSVKLPDFARIASVADKKQQFFDFLTPAIRQENQQLLALRERLLLLNARYAQGLNAKEQTFINELALQYKLKKQLTLAQQLEQLLNCVDQVPEALVLVQAANESAWGTSRFARIGLNFFGIWCYKPKCGMVPNGRSGDDRHEVAAFNSVEKAVHRYFYNINTHAAYKVFRHIRSQLRAQKQPLYPDVLASGLLAYSARGEHYVLEITKMIAQNQAYFSSEQTALAD
jgi:Bax protein